MFDVSESSSKKLKLEHNDSGVDPDQERHEKRRYSAMLYQKYLHRGGPKHHGQKDLPKVLTLNNSGNLCLFSLVNKNWLIYPFF